MSELALRLIEENKRTKDTFLDLGNCGLVNELPGELLECVWLESLCLGSYYFDQEKNEWFQSKNNQPTNQFKGQELVILQNFTKLGYLYIGDIKIQDYSFLQSLTQLHALDISNNQIQDFSFLQSLGQLKSLHLITNQLRDISFLQNLKQLQSLNLDQNQIQDISSLQSLTQLQYLDLGKNKIENIKPLLFLLKNGLEVTLDRDGGSGISLYNNPITNPPIEIVKQGREAILRYSDRIEQEGKDFIFEAKLTLVGDGGSGKTSLQRRILDENAELPTGGDRTRGIKVYDWEFNDADGKTYTTHIWDFGGQDVYYPVHRFFLTENSVYVLMASTRYSVHNFEYWIPTIYQFGGDSPIILVQTCDNGHQKDWTDIKTFMVFRNII